MAATFSHLSFTIPQEDAREWAGLPQKTKDRVGWLLDIMEVIAAAPKNRTAHCQVFADAAGKHFNSIYQPWKRFSESGDWRHLIDKRYCSEFWKRDETKRVGLPAEFITEWKFLVESNDRKAKPVHARLIYRWKQWRNGDLSKAVPGYSRCPDAAPGSRIPLGWNYSNLLNHMPSDVEMAAARKGRTAARNLLAGVRTSRVGGYPFAEIQFDDMWHNFLVNVPNYAKAYRLLEFGCTDHFSTYIFQPGLKPRLPDMDSGKMKVLNSRDFHLYLVNWLLDYGVHPDGTVWNVENGTASITKAFEEKLLRWFGGRLTILRPGMSGAPAFGGAYNERAKGNYRVKALKEGRGNHIQNALGHIPGQVGMHRDDSPAHLTGREKENEMLLALAAAVPALRDKLELGFLNLKEAVFAVNETYGLLNSNFDHENEGWEESGLVIEEIRFSKLSDDWLSMEEVLALPAEHRALLPLALKLDPTMRRRRKLSAAECILVHQTRLIKLPHEAIPDLLGPDYGNVREVKGGQLAFTYPGIGKIRYKANYQDADGFVRRVENGTKILTHFNPWKPEFLYLSDAKTGRYLGRAARDHAATRGDVDAIMRKHGENERDYKDAIRETAMRHGLKRLPHINLNTAAIRQTTKPSARDQALAEANLSASALLDIDDEGDFAEPISAAYFDPADLL